MSDFMVPYQCYHTWIGDPEGEDDWRDSLIYCNLGFLSGLTDKVGVFCRDLRN